MNDIKPIETRYKGYRFRSRLEARWAVFFDSLGVTYEYELEGFNAGNKRYLPDFKVWGSLGMVVRAENMASRLRPEKAATAERSATAWGNGLSILAPTAPMAVWFEVKPHHELTDDDKTKVLAFAKDSAGPLIVTKGDPYENDLLFVGRSPDVGYSMGKAIIGGSKGGNLLLLVQGVGCESDKFYAVAEDFRELVLPAATAARSARFEHGEHG